MLKFNLTLFHTVIRIFHIFYFKTKANPPFLNIRVTAVLSYFHYKRALLRNFDPDENKNLGTKYAKVYLFVWPFHYYRKKKTYRLRLSKYAHTRISVLLLLFWGFFGCFFFLVFLGVFFFFTYLRFLNLTEHQNKI